MTRRLESLYLDDASAGAEIPPFSNTVTLLQLNWFAGANRELHPIHMDRDYCQKVLKLPDVLIMGHLKAAYISNMLDDWMGESGWISRLNTRFRGLDFPGDTLTARGIVTSATPGENGGTVECEVWVENQRGERNTLGSAVVLLPSRHGGL